jgi:mono/diheme cytochrome c family protein
MKKLFLAGVSLALLLSSLCRAEDLTQNAVYKSKCAVCHGANAEGKPALKAPALKPAAAKNEAALTKAIEDGGSAAPAKMPPFKDKLTPDQIKSLVAGIKDLK